MAGFDLVEPRSLEEAFGFLECDDPAVRPVGGGTALMLMMKAQLFSPARLVSLRRIAPRFTGFEISAGGASMRVGAMTTFSALEQSALVREHLPVIAPVMKTLANPRVRNVATIGGNLAHADPHLDLPPVWMALGAAAVILNPVGERIVPVEDIFAGYYETTLQHNDLIAELSVPLRPTWRSTYVKVTTRAIHDWPAIGIAISADLDGPRVKDIRLVLSAAIDKPTRLFATEAVLSGAEIDDATLRRAGEAAVAETDIAADNRGSATYKKHLLRVHLARALRELIGERR